MVSVQFEVNDFRFDSSILLVDYVSQISYLPADGLLALGKSKESLILKMYQAAFIKFPVVVLQMDKHPCRNLSLLSVGEYPAGPTKFLNSSNKNEWTLSLD